MAAYADALNELNAATQTSSGGGSSGGGSVESLLRNKAAEYDIDPDLFVSLAKRESGLRPDARNPNPGSTAGGLFQFIDGTWNRYGNKRDKFDPEANADAAARMLRDHLGMFGGDYNKALAAHHVGAGKAERALTDGSIGDVDVSTQKWLSEIYKGAGRDGAPGNQAASENPNGLTPAPRSDYSRAFEHFSSVPGSTLDDQLKAGEAPKESGINYSKEIGAAIDSYQSNLWAIPAAMGSEYALKAMQENKAAAEKNWQESGAPQSFDEMEFGKNFGNYFAHMGLQSAPYMVEFMATGFGVGSAAKAALAKTAKGVAEKAAIEAAKLGATKEVAKKAGEAAAAQYMGKVYTASGVAGSYPSAVGDVLSNQHEQAGKFDLGTAAALGVPYAALNAAGAEGMLTRAVARGLPKTAITKEGVAGFAGRAALTGAEAGVMEGSTETGQEVMNQLGRMAVDPNANIDDPRALAAYKESFIAGGLMGGVPGAAAGGFRKVEDAPPVPIANSPLTNAANQAQHIQKQQQKAQVEAGWEDDHRAQIIGMMAQRDDLTEKIAGLQNMIDRADPSSEDGQLVRARQSDLVMRRDALVSQLDAAKAFYGADQTANVGPQDDQLLQRDEQLANTYQAAKHLLDNPSTLDPQSRNELLNGFAILRNKNLPDQTRIDAAIGLLATMDNLAARRAEQAQNRATEGEWNSFLTEEQAIDNAAKEELQDKQAANVGPKPLPPKQKPAVGSPAGSFANLAEFEQFRKEEEANIERLRQEGMASQDVKKMDEADQREAKLQEINQRIEANRIAESAKKRGDLLDRVLATNPQNPLRSFDRALRLEGFRDTAFTEEEKAKIAGFNEQRASAQMPMDAKPNEGGDFGIREKKDSAPAGRFQHINDMLGSGWNQINKFQLASPKGEIYNLKGNGEVQYVRNKLNQKAANGNEANWNDSPGSGAQGDLGVGGERIDGNVSPGGESETSGSGQDQDPAALDGSVQQADAVGNASQQDQPLSKRSRLTPLDDPRVRNYANDLRSMAPDSGWAEDGGKLIRHEDGTMSRTRWVPRAEWFMAGMLQTPNESLAAVDKAIAGQPMRKAEKLHVQGMMDFLDHMNGIRGESHHEQLATLSDIAYESETKEDQAIIDALGDVDLDSVGAWNDEVESMRALGFTEEEINEITRRKQGAFGSVGESTEVETAGEAQAAIPQGDGNGNGQAEGQASQDGFSLNQQTEEELRAKAEAEAKAAAEEAAAKKSAEDKAKADAEANDFRLSGSDRPADVAVSGGQQGLFGANGEPTKAAAPQRQPHAAIITDSKGNQTSINNALDVEIAELPELKFFSFVASDGSARVTETSTGGNVASGANEAEAIASFKDLIKNRGAEFIRGVIANAPKIKQEAKESPVDTSEVTKAIERAKRLLRETRHKIENEVKTKERKAELIKREADLEREIRKLRQMAIAEEPVEILHSKNAELKNPATLDEFVGAVDAGYRARYDYAGRDGSTVWIEKTEVAGQPAWVMKWIDEDYPGTTQTKGGAGQNVWDKLKALRAVEDKVKFRFTEWKSVADSAPSPVDASMRDTGAKAFADGLPRVAPEGIKGADKVRWLTGYDDAQKAGSVSQPKTDTAPKAEEQAAPVSPEQNDKPAYADDAELQDALSHLGDVLGDVFGAKLNITGKQFGASDVLPAMSKVIELLIKKGFKSFRESVGAATNAMRGNANTKGFVDQITPRQWKAAYNSVAEFHEGTDSEEDVAKYSAEQVQKIIALPEKIKEAEQKTDHGATPGQKEAGNYAKGKFAWHGLNIAVETAKGEYRTDKETNGDKWRVKMPATYGYVLGTEGADGDHLDVFMGDKPESQRVYVINQTKPGSTDFDEHKVMLGYDSEDNAMVDYLLSFSGTFGHSVLGSISGPYTVDYFKQMVDADRFKKAKPLDDTVAYVNPRMEEQASELSAVSSRMVRGDPLAGAYHVVTMSDGSTVKMAKSDPASDNGLGAWHIDLDDTHATQKVPGPSQLGHISTVLGFNKEEAMQAIPDKLRQMEKYRKADAPSAEEASKYAATVAAHKARQEERAIVPLENITVTRAASLDGKPVEYDQQADEALKEIDDSMNLARNLLNCLAA